ncbi:hypothetical protein CSB45_12815 [candidate division KSB3 bacterium]|uniref:Large ribosomal subunit protein bL12 C-terminal domain-containing protein n=1 Tax=candidate division KSB3 bacterium TaxID=2044937 RepID=A0A2G6E1X8_9BACT|nr:MAG: hypothetical protein CSB45_12815 [candidate division KSB3 bacterium]PIE28773.1 MAG: hypothetical protein CSA57_12130 [candidate division KSB3 bacterium]
MADIHELVNIELVDASVNSSRVIQVLSKVSGLAMTPAEIIESVPCIIAEDVPRSMAEKLQRFLEKAGAMVNLKSPGDAEEEELEFELELEDEERLFSPDDLSGTEALRGEGVLEIAPAPDQLSRDESDDLVLDEYPRAADSDRDAGLDGPSEDFGGFSAASTLLDEEADAAEDEELWGTEDDGFESDVEKNAASSDLEKSKKKKFSLPFFTKKVRSDAAGADESDPGGETGEKKGSTLPNGLLAAVVSGFILGALLFGVWGMLSKRRLQRELQAVGAQTPHRAELQQKLDEQAREITRLKQLTAKTDRAAPPQSISPSLVPDGNDSDVLAAILSSFESLKDTHLESLTTSAETQQKASCSRQVLLDGKGTLTYAQVVKRFSAKYTAFDVMRSPSLITPFVAELKIPFKQEIRVGADETSCNAASFTELPTPRHHEFGGFYGIWIVEYLYKNGRWVRKPTVTERNRALYAQAFVNGSPDYARFLIDETLYPGFDN